MEDFLSKKFKPGYGISRNGKKVLKSTCINLVRYADDFITTGRSLRQLERVKVAINEFLKPRGLKINEDKTSFRPDTLVKVLISLDGILGNTIILFYVKCISKTRKAYPNTVSRLNI